MWLKPALIVLDIQNIWLDTSPVMKKGIETRAMAINDAIAWFRKSNLPVIVVYHSDRGRGPFPGTKAFEVFDQISVRESDVKIVKNYPSSFAKTPLDETLKKNGCDSIAIVGLSANWCVLATYFGAMEYGLDPYVLRGCVAADREEHVRYAEEVYDAISLEKFEEKFRK